jgi:hypothetical protein
MAIITLTDKQRISIEGNADFQNLLRTAIFNEAIYKKTLSGAGLVNADAANVWAKERFLAYGVVHNPGGIDFTSWLKQAIMILKDMAVYDNANTYLEATVIDYMIANSKFTELAGLVFAMKREKIEF